MVRTALSQCAQPPVVAEQCAPPPINARVCQDMAMSPAVTSRSVFKIVNMGVYVQPQIHAHAHLDGSTPTALLQCVPKHVVMVPTALPLTLAHALLSGKDLTVEPLYANKIAGNMDRASLLILVCVTPIGVVLTAAGLSLCKVSW